MYIHTVEIIFLLFTLWFSTVCSIHDRYKSVEQIQVSRTRTWFGQKEYLLKPTLNSKVQPTLLNKLILWRQLNPHLLLNFNQYKETKCYNRLMVTMSNIYTLNQRISIFQTNLQHKSVILSNIIYPSHAIGYYKLVQYLQHHCKQLVLGSRWFNTRWIATYI